VGLDRQLRQVPIPFGDFLFEALAAIHRRMQDHTGMIGKPAVSSVNVLLRPSLFIAASRRRPLRKSFAQEPWNGTTMDEGVVKPKAKMTGIELSASKTTSSVVDFYSRAI